MTDMPAFYPRQLISAVEQRIQKGQPVHSIVLWTRHPKSLLNLPLYEAINRWKGLGIQIALQLTVTGYGGISFMNKSGESVMVEPNVPPARGVVDMFGDLVQLTGVHALITVRFDPVMKIVGYGGMTESNLSFLPVILEGMHKAALKSMVYSFLEPAIYRKVVRHFGKAGLEIEGFTENAKIKTREFIDKMSEQFDVVASPCCVGLFEQTACLDGRKLNKIKGDTIEPDYKELHRRPNCGCTRSIDLGGWPPKPCYSGCLYCYANPVISDKLEINKG